MHIPIASIEHVVILTAPYPGLKEHLAASELQRGLWQLGYRRHVITGELPHSGDTQCTSSAFIGHSKV